MPDKKAFVIVNSNLSKNEDASQIKIFDIEDQK
jgi:hypothetical protein